MMAREWDDSEKLMTAKIDPWQEQQREKQRMAGALDARPGNVLSEAGSPSPIASARINATREGAELMKTLEELRDRLGFVLAPRVPETASEAVQKNAAERQKSDVAHAFDAMALNFLACRAICVDILRRLEV